MFLQKLLFIFLIGFIDSLTDPSSFANYDQIIQTKVEANFKVNFDEQYVSVTEKLYLKALMDGEVIVLDTAYLIIESVVDSNTGEDLPYAIDELNTITPLGTPIKIYINYKKDEEVILLIKCRTTEGGDAIGFIGKELTEGQRYPYVFTQCQSIMARSVLPLQDTPAVKLPIYASMTVPKPMLGVYAGIFKSKTEQLNTTTYYYEQLVPIPSYLIAFAAGAIEERIISDRVKIYAEKEIVDQAAREFNEIEKFIQVAEAYIFDYEWGEYNLLILPRSFPFGGMENPCLTFVTPTIIAGDKSLATVVMHEISHSWAGNLVTMKEWSEFWLNEGFDVFIERKITQILYGDDRMKISAAAGVKVLQEEIDGLGETHEFTKMIVNIIGRSPEESYNEVSYEKGFNFVYYLQQLVNSNSDRDTFKMILKDYFNEFKFKSIMHEDFQRVFNESLHKYLPDKADDILKAVDWNTWYFEPGMPPVENDFSNTLSKQADEYYAKLLDNTIKLDEFKPIWDGWHTSVKEYFLKNIIALGDKVTDQQYKFLSESMKLPEGCNADITSDFYQIMLNIKKEDKMDKLDEFLGYYGRLKYLKPLYAGVAKIDKGKAMALFNKHKHTYHPIAITNLEQLLKTI